MRITRSPLLLGILVTFLVAACSSRDQDQDPGDDGPPIGDDDDDDGGGPAPGQDAGPGGGTPDAGPGGGTPDGSVPQELHVCATGAPYATIGAAIAAANPGDTIDVCSGTYLERIVIDKALHLRGAGSATTTIDGQSGGTTVTVPGTGDAGVIVEGFTITGGASSAEGGGVRCDSSALTLQASALVDNTAAGGGGLYATSCALDVHDTVFRQNSGGPTGGGAMLANSAGSVSHCRFDANQAGHGGGLAIIEGEVSVLSNELSNNHAGTQGGGLWLSSDSEVADNSVHDNQGGWTAGGIYVFQHAPLIHDNTVTANSSANDGGGFYLHQSMATLRANLINDNDGGDDAGGIRVFESMAVLDSNTIENNLSLDGGGGIKISHAPSTLIDNVIRNNQSGTGGGIMMDNDASTVTGGEISGNTASTGGGIYATLGPWTGAHLENILISGNNAWIGGGLTLTANFESVKMKGLTIIDNTATNVGGGILARGSEYELVHSLVAGNTALSGGGIYHGVADPYTDPCPCPMTTTIGHVRFSVLYANGVTNGAGSALYGETDGLTIEDSILYGHEGMSVDVAPATVWRYNDAMPATFSRMSNPSGVDGNLAAAPQFVDPTHGDFHLGPGSICIDAGDPALVDLDDSRADMGLFGGTP